jgi:hypothetical protein
VEHDPAADTATCAAVPGVAIPLPGVAINMFAGPARANESPTRTEAQELVVDVGDEAALARRFANT